MSWIKEINLKKILGSKAEIAVFALIILLASLIRFYHLDRLGYFTYDQARDVLYIKRILVDHKFRLIGTQSSIPGLYTPPFYYYLMAPFLLAFNFNPVGLDFATAFFGVLTICLLYLVLKQVSDNQKINLAITALYAFQPAIVYQSRFAWNPNTTPFFVLLAIYSFFKILKSKESVCFYLLLFFSLGMTVNLHYSGVALLAAFLLAIILYRKKFNLKNLGFGFLTLFFLLSPLIFFDVRHKFINLKGVANYFLYNSRNEVPPPPFFEGLWEKYQLLAGLVLPSGVSRIFFNFGFFAFALIMIYAFAQKNKKRSKLVPVFLIFFFSLIFSSVYQRGFYSFYLTFLYPLPFLILGIAASFIRAKKLSFAAGLVIFLGLVLNLSSSVKQVSTQTPSLSQQLMPVASFLSEKVVSPFVLASVYSGNDRFGHNAVDYRYFLETYFSKSSLDWDPADYQQAENLYLISEAGELDPLQSGIWEIQMFKAGKVKDVWQVGDAIVYHLVK